ncbi:MAG TPA: 3-deoxy-8-phosphooctulonate synthase, partial [Bacteroidales bacterium]|nr:3-deoxy-8-phosphooctulonate synthase [Bacteroidales bacterium]
MKSDLYNQLAGAENFFLLAGPCVVESKDLCFEVADSIKKISEKLN